MTNGAAWFFDLGDTLVGNGAWLPGAELMLDRLGLNGVPIGIISNTGMLTRIQLRLLLPDSFDFGVFSDPLVLLSSEIGLEKPDARIFRLAIERSGLPPKRCIFVGEDLVETLAAQEVGMRAARIWKTEHDFEALFDVLGA